MNFKNKMHEETWEKTEMSIEDRVSHIIDTDRSSFSVLTDYETLDKFDIRMLTTDLLCSYRVFMKCVADVLDRNASAQSKKDSLTLFLQSSLDDMGGLIKKYETKEETA